MNPSSSSGNHEKDQNQKRKATEEPASKPKKVRITYDPLKVNSFEAMMSGDYSRRVYQPLGESPPSSPSSLSSSSFSFLESPSSSSDHSSPSTHSTEISSSLSHPFPTRTPSPYSLVFPDSRFTVIHPTPTPHSPLEMLHSDVNSWLDILGAAHRNHLDESATCNLWEAFRQDFLTRSMGVQRRIMAEAPGARGLLLEAGENLCRDIVVWRPRYLVLLTGDFQWLFGWFRMNPSESAPHMAFPEVVYPAEDAGPTPPTNLADILQALEVGASVLPEPEYTVAGPESDSDVEKEGTEAEDLPEDRPAENAVSAGRSSGVSSSGEPSALMKTLEDLHQNQATLTSRLEAQEAVNAEFRSFMAKQIANSNRVQDILAQILSQLGS